MDLTDQQIDFALSSNLNYVECVHGEILEDYSKEVIRLTDKESVQRLAIKACHAVGKTFTLGRIIEAMMSRFNYIKIISTAPTFRQVKDLLWKEIHSAHTSKPSEFRRGKLNETDWLVDPETFARGFSPQIRVKSESGQGTDSVFQGYHGKFMTVVVFDEATGIDHQIWTQAEGLLTSGSRVLFIAIANPTSRNCKFFDCFQDPTWTTFSITCFDSPNLQAAGIHSIDDIQREADKVESIDPEDAQEYLASYPNPKPYLVSARWVVEKAIEWGVDHPLFKGKVIGEFPDEDENVLIPERIVRLAQARLIEEGDKGFIGLDVARFGTDKSVLTGLKGWKQIGKKPMTKMDTNEVVGETINFVEKNYPSDMAIRLAVDGGFGHGVIDVLKERKADKSKDNERAARILKNVTILEVNFGSSDWVLRHYGWKDEKTSSTKKNDRKVQESRENYANFKAEMFDFLRRDLTKHIQLLPDKAYSKQLPSIITTSDSKGRLRIESKDDYKDRTGESSPDEADSLALANYARYFAVKRLSVTDAMKARRSA